LFAGIGAPRKALTNLGIEHTSTISEIDKHAIASYTAVHGETDNLGDIKNIEKLPECDLLSTGFPCTDISNAGKQMGMAKGSETRSSLLWEVERLLMCSPLPKTILIENVKALTGEKFKKDLNRFIGFLSTLGYTSSWTILNAKDFGVPQNRERFFMVSCLDGTHFQFPKGFKSSVCLKDILETNVDESYYLTADQIKNFEAHKERHQSAGHGFGWEPQDGSKNAVALTNNPYRHGQNFIVDGVKIAGDLNDPKRIEMMNRVYDGDGISPTLPSIHGGGHECYDWKQTVRIRKESPDIPKLQAWLRSQKAKSKLTKKQIAERLSIPETKVEHWFRTDDCFAIPDAEVWYDLLKLFDADKTEFDDQITEFQTADSKHDQTNRVYDSRGQCPTLTATGDTKIHTNDTPSDTINIINGTKKGYLEGTDGDSVILIFPETNRIRGRVQKGIASTLMTDGNGLGVITKTPPAEEEAFTLTSSATEVRPVLNNAMCKGAKFKGPPTKDDGEDSFTLTTGKPHGVEIKNIGNLNDGSNSRGDVFDTDGLSPTLLECAGEKGNKTLIHEKEIFIRKLTEREYWRLMAFTDEDFDKASKVSSRTQLYKQAGNSIVVSVLEAIFDCLYNKKQPKTKLLSQFAEGS